MGLLKFVVIGAAVAYGINHITKKRPDGSSLLDDITDSAPEWMDKIKLYAEETIDKVAENIKQSNTYSRPSAAPETFE